MGLYCVVCEHDHEDDGSCHCGCTVEAELEEICQDCGHADHAGRDCKCGCPG